MKKSPCWNPFNSRNKFVAFVVAMVCVTGQVRADERWLVSADAPGAFALSAPQNSWFGVGSMPAAAVHRSVSSWFLLGLRLRAGVLSNGSAPGAGIMDPGPGGMGALSACLRVRPFANAKDSKRGTGAWVEVSGGGAITGSLLRPVSEVGMGWAWAAGSVNVGPSLRYLQMFQGQDDLSAADAKIALVGIELSLLDAPKVKQVETVPTVRQPVITDRDSDGIVDEEDGCPDVAEDFDSYQDDDGCAETDNDNDKISDVLDRCPNEPETVNGNSDEDGCPDEGLFVVVEDRIVLEEKVLFDTDKTRVKQAGNAVIAAIVGFWKSHPEYERMVVEGHADERGVADHNLDLSANRSANVKKLLVRLGAAPSKVEVIAYGESKPRALGHSEKDWELNRRVEFVLIRTRKETRTIDGGSANPTGEQESSLQKMKGR